MSPSFFARIAAYHCSWLRRQFVGYMRRDDHKAGGTVSHEDVMLVDKGAFKDLGDGAGLAINDRGQIVGSAFGHAALWLDGRYIALPGLSSDEGVAYDINNKGQIVGASQRSPSRRYMTAILWQGGRLWDLNGLIPPHSGWDLQVAVKINENGQILVSGHWQGALHGCLLMPDAASVAPAPANMRNHRP